MAERIDTANTAQLEHWLVRVLTAEHVDEVFK